MVEIYFIEGTIQKHGREHVHIYVKGEEGKKLVNHVGKKVKGFIVIIEDESKK